MPRKPRKRPEREVKKIEIERNVIEQFLMDAKDFLKNKRKVALYSLAAFFAVLVLVVVAVIVVDSVNTRNNIRFERIMDKYAKNSEARDAEKMKGVGVELKKFIDDTYFGVAHAMACYALGNLYYDQKEYIGASKYLQRYADKKPKTSLAPLALLKAAIALEEAKDLKGAMELYKRLEDKYATGMAADQIFFNEARVYGKLNDSAKARDCYNRVISSFPDSAYAQMAKKRLFLLGGN